MMLEVHAVGLSPLFIGAAPEAGNVVHGLPFIPGSVLRGALAARWIRESGPPSPGDSDFRETFDGSVRFGALLPEGARLEPVSVLRCKHERGSDCHKEAVDLLWKPRKAQCSSCEGPLEAGKGRVLVGDEGRVTQAKKHTYTRVELTVNETAKRGQLFSREAIPIGTRLVGKIMNPTPWLEDLAGEGGIDLWFGGRRTVGSHAHVRFEEGSDPEPPKVRGDGAELALTLRSPGVFVDGSTRPCLGLPTDEVARRLGLDPGKVEVENEWVRVERVSGWHAASGLPKPEDLALSPGSSAVIRLPEPVGSERLAELARGGLGLRRSEGFGWVDVNPPPWKPPDAKPPKVDSGRRPEVEALLQRDDIRGDRRLLDWICVELRQQAERAEVRRRWRIEAVLDQRRELRYAGSDLRDAVAELFDSGKTPEELRSTADELEGSW